MIYLLISIFGVLSVITLKLFLQIDESKKYCLLKKGLLLVVSIGLFISVSFYLLNYSN